MPHQATAQQEQPSSPSVPPALVLHLGDLLLLLAEGPLHHLGPLAELGRDGLQDLAPTQLLQLALRLLLITIPSRHKHTHQTRSSVVEPSKCRDTNIAHQTSSSPLLPPTTLSGLALTWQPRRPHTAWRRAWGVDTRCLLPAPRGRPPRRRPTPRPLLTSASGLGRKARGSASDCPALPASATWGWDPREERQDNTRWRREPGPALFESVLNSALVNRGSTGPSYKLPECGHTGRQDMGRWPQACSARGWYLEESLDLVLELGVEGPHLVHDGAELQQLTHHRVVLHAPALHLA
jgi:hypothetical protein